jgi:hypothetical protein
MRCTYHMRKVLSAVPSESRCPVAVGRDGQRVSPPLLGTSGNDFDCRITRTEIMNYLNQTYGPVFMENLMKHLPSSSDDKK